jgi:hypothetical protein
VVPAVAQVRLSKPEARGVILREFPAHAPSLMLDESRARFFHTAKLTVEPAGECARQSPRRVACHFTVKLRPDRRHRRRGWFPIRCTGDQRVRKRDDLSYVGTMGDYRCRTVR